jgi:hypothetical protein
LKNTESIYNKLGVTFMAHRGWCLKTPGFGGGPALSQHLDALGC